MHLAFAAVHRHDRPLTIGMHTHEALELIYYIKGKGRTRIGQTQYSFRRHTFAIAPAGMQHDQMDDGCVTSLCIGIEESGLERFPGCYSDHGGELGRTSEQVVNELQQQRPAWSVMVEGLLREAVALAERAVLENGAPPRKEAIARKALDIIRCEEGRLSVSDLSDMLFVSNDYLRHLVREVSGESPMRHIVRARIDRAVDLLQHTSLAVGVIAEQCGFESPYYFSRLFKKVTGQTPTQCRRKRLA